MEFKDKVVIVTGGSRGIGRACCIDFGRLGAKVVFTYNRSKERADELKEELEAEGVSVVGIQADVREYEQCRMVVAETLKAFNKIDILINNAGITRDRALAMMALEDWGSVIDTNLGGVFNMTRAVIITFLKQKRGCIINMSSVSGLFGIPRQTNYSASKAGIIGFSKSLAKEVASYNIRVNVVCPGYIDTGMVGSLREDLRKKILEGIPLGRLGKPEEVSQLCVFLASDKAGYITGEVIKIDGGLAG